MIQQREILLVPFPFSDQSGKKVRPVTVVSNEHYNKNSEDLIVIGITSTKTKSEYSLNLTNKDLDYGNLISPCTLKCENILKINKNLIVKKIGKINKEKLGKIREKLLRIIS